MTRSWTMVAKIRRGKNNWVARLVCIPTEILDCQNILVHRPQVNACWSSVPPAPVQRVWHHFPVSLLPTLSQYEEICCDTPSCSCSSTIFFYDAEIPRIRCTCAV